MKWTEEDREKLNIFINELLYEKMTIDDYELVMNRLGADCKGNRYRTICHNIEGGGYNLSFNKENRCYTCFSECGCSYSLLGLVKKVLELRGEGKGVVKALRYICNIIGVKCDFNESIKINNDLYNWKGLLKYVNKGGNDKVNKVYDKGVLNRLDRGVYGKYQIYIYAYFYIFMHKKIICKIYA